MSPYAASKAAWHRRNRDRQAADRVSPAKGLIYAHAAIDVSHMPRVDRDPCPRCGVRRDFGCGHLARALTVGPGV
jgi:hypothetical protein